MFAVELFAAALLGKVMKARDCRGLGQEENRPDLPLF